jgi:hypothetical protein
VFGFLLAIAARNRKTIALQALCAYKYFPGNSIGSAAGFFGDIYPRQKFEKNPRIPKSQNPKSKIPESKNPREKL